jgi:ribosomal protein L30E
MLGNIKVLLLTGNRLTSGKGLEKLYAVEYLAIGEKRQSELPQF